MRKLLPVLLLICFLAAFDSPARRTQESIRKEKQETAQKIDRTKRQIKDNEAETRRELKNLQTIEGQMRERRADAARLRKDVDYLRAQNRSLTDSIKANATRIEGLKASYAKSLRAIRRQRHLGSEAAFIFSAGTYSRARGRIRYLRELAAWQQEKSAEIQHATALLDARRERLDSLEGAVRAGLDSITAIETGLREQKHRADAIVGSLKRQSKNLGKVLAEQEAQARKLDQELNRIIEEEARKSRTPGDATPAQGASFAQNKGKLPLPIDKKATVIASFGRHQHEDYAKVEVQNNGIDFETSPGASARCVFPGVVSMVIKMDGYNNVVLVRHGEYLTVYAGISKLNVHKGQQLAAGDLIGTIFSDPADDGRTRLHFEVRHEIEKLDPAQWLR